MKIENIRVEDLHPYERNPRKNDAAVGPVAESIRQFGFKVPIIIDRNNEIIAGHTRLKAAELLGLETVPCIRADDLSDEQVKAFRLADNKVAEFAEWDPELLDWELSDLKLEDIDMSVFGFDADELLEKKPEVVEQPDLAPHLPGSRVAVFSISAFGTDGECFVSLPLSEDEAEAFLDGLGTKYSAQEVAERIREAINDL